jgi:hypothetical protein
MGGIGAEIAVNKGVGASGSEAARERVGQLSVGPHDHIAVVQRAVLPWTRLASEPLGQRDRKSEGLDDLPGASSAPELDE